MTCRYDVNYCLVHDIMFLKSESPKNNKYVIKIAVF